MCVSVEDGGKRKKSAVFFMWEIESEREREGERDSLGDNIHSQSVGGRRMGERDEQRTRGEMGCASGSCTNVRTYHM